MARPKKAASTPSSRKLVPLAPKPMHEGPEQSQATTPVAGDYQVRTRIRGHKKRLSPDSIQTPQGIKKIADLQPGEVNKQAVREQVLKRERERRYYARKQAATGRHCCIGCQCWFHPHELSTHQQRCCPQLKDTPEAVAHRTPPPSRRRLLSPISIRTPQGIQKITDAHRSEFDKQSKERRLQNRDHSRRHRARARTSEGCECCTTCGHYFDPQELSEHQLSCWGRSETPLFFSSPTTRRLQQEPYTTTARHPPPRDPHTQMQPHQPSPHQSPSTSEFQSPPQQPPHPTSNLSDLPVRGDISSSPQRIPSPLRSVIPPRKGSEYAEFCRQQWLYRE